MDGVSEEDELLRRVFAFHLNDDGTVRSSAFELRPGERGVSVDFARIRSIADALAAAGRNDLGMVVLAARVPHEIGFVVQPDPLPDNQAHALIVGPFTQSNRRKLAGACRVAVPPPVLGR